MPTNKQKWPQMNKYVSENGDKYKSIPILICVAVFPKSNNLCKSSCYHLHALRYIRASLSDDICFSLAAALIQSRLYYSNSELYGTSSNGTKHCG